MISFIKLSRAVVFLLASASPALAIYCHIPANFFICSMGNNIKCPPSQMVDGCPIAVAPVPRGPLAIGIQFTYLGTRRMPIGSVFVSDRLGLLDLSMHIPKYQYADPSDKLIASCSIERKYINRLSNKISDFDSKYQKYSDLAATRIVLIYGENRIEYYLPLKQSIAFYNYAISEADDRDLVKLLQCHAALLE